jgi:hypothetical protein
MRPEVIVAIVLIAVVLLAFSPIIASFIYCAIIDQREQCEDFRCTLISPLLEDYRDVITSRVAINVLVSKKASEYLSLNLITSIGLKDATTIESLSELPRLEKPVLLVLHVDDVLEAESSEVLLRSLGGLEKFALMILNPEGNLEKSRRLLGVILEFYESRNTSLIIPIEPYPHYAKDKLEAPTIHSGLLSAEALVFSVNPTGLIVVERFIDKAWIILTVLKWTELISVTPASSERLVKLIGASSIVKQVNAISAGYVGWITANTTTGSVGEEVIEVMGVKVNYYYTSIETLSGKEYHTWLVYAEQSARGVVNKCRVRVFCPLVYSWFMPPCCPRCEDMLLDCYPLVFSSMIDWRSEEWPGQVLHDWLPKNVGVASNVSLTTWLLSVQYYAPSTVEFEWWDHSEPWKGVTSTEYHVKASEDDRDVVGDATITIGALSVALLDPDRPGGRYPVIMRHVFTTRNYCSYESTNRVEFWVYISRNP